MKIWLVLGSALSVFLPMLALLIMGLKIDWNEDLIRLLATVMEDALYLQLGCVLAGGAWVFFVIRKTGIRPGMFGHPFGFWFWTLLGVVLYPLNIFLFNAGVWRELDAADRLAPPNDPPVRS